MEHFPSRDNTEMLTCISLSIMAIRPGVSWLSSGGRVDQYSTTSEERDGQTRTCQGLLSPSRGAKSYGCSGNRMRLGADAVTGRLVGDAVESNGPIEGGGAD